ncbi:MAG: PQQ-dependent sugar dehydrogenase, partial [Verrucomicrobiota bacterium]
MFRGNKYAVSWLLLLGLSFSIVSSPAATLPPMFEDRTVLDNLQDPAGIRFTPDGARLFIGERITGQLRVATFNPTNSLWELLPTPFATLNVPSTRHRSAGLRGFTFDPDFASNGYVYVFYMQDNPRHNRVSRLQADPGNRDIMLGGSELVLIDLPFNTSASSGSHNGGDMEFGADGMLYISTGDGWNGGDAVQSLSTFTGKMIRIGPDGTIPTNNPFYATASGMYRAIYALGLRNPYSMSYHAELGSVFVNDAVGSNKDVVFQVMAGANYGHQGSGGGGIPTAEWARVGGSGMILVTGGAWYPSLPPSPRPFRAAYHGSYLVALWGSNGAGSG